MQYISSEIVPLSSVQYLHSMHISFGLCLTPIKELLGSFPSGYCWKFGNFRTISLKLLLFKNQVSSGIYICIYIYNHSGSSPNYSYPTI
jgi:hypothetical protein